MNYETSIKVNKQKRELFNHLMNNDDTATYDPIELPVAILDATFENKIRAIISLSGVETNDNKNNVWVDVKLVDENNVTLTTIAPQTELYDTFVINNDGDTYTLTVSEE